MDYGILGRTGLKVSKISYGCAGFTSYTPTSEEETKQSVFKAIDEYGINYFDTSPTYGGTESERITGEILQGRRHEVILATKTVRFVSTTGKGIEFDESAARIRKELEGQLKRLKTDYVDILQMHDVEYANLDRLVEETVPEMEKLRKEGKIRFIGITGRTLGAIKYVLDRTDSIDSILAFARYNLLDTSAATYFEKEVKERNIGLLNCSVLYMRALTRSAAEGNLSSDFLLKQFTGEKMEALKKANELCLAKGVDLGELAFQFGTDTDAFASTVVSMAHVRRLDQNMALYNAPYDKELAAEVYALLSGQNILPSNEDFTPEGKFERMLKAEA